jgi:hypothetical protein
LELTIYEISLVEATIFPVKSAFAMFLAFEEISFVDSFAIVPAFLAFPMLKIVKPLSGVSGSIGVYKRSMAISLVVFPLSLVDISVGMSHPTHAIAFIKSPLAFIL